MKKFMFFCCTILSFPSFAQLAGDTLFGAPMVHEIYFQFFKENIFIAFIRRHLYRKNNGQKWKCDGEEVLQKIGGK